MFINYNLGIGDFLTSVMISRRDKEWIRLALFRDIDGKWAFEAGDVKRQLFGSVWYDHELRFVNFSLGMIPAFNVLQDIQKQRLRSYGGYTGCIDDFVVAKGHETLDLTLVQSEKSSTCSRAFDPCQSTPCLNGGSCEQTKCSLSGQCLEGDRVYTCMCAIEYTGYHCESSIGKQTAIIFKYIYIYCKHIVALDHVSSLSK